MKYTILNIKDTPDLIEEVVALGDSQKSTLGFLPEHAFFEYADKGNILVAVSDEGLTLGYILFAQKRNLTCRLAHVCVQPAYRNEGIAAALIAGLKKHTAHMRRIILKCRRDYGIASFWQKNGFTAIGETEGRGRGSNILTIWEFTSQPTLLALAPDTDRVMVVLDLNIVIAAMTEDNDECVSLLNFTYADEIDYRVSKYSYTEANKNNDAEKRKATRQYLDSFSKIPICPNTQLISNITNIIGARHSDDAQQIASAIHSGARYFITNDILLARYSKDIASKYGTSLLTPTEFIISYCNGSGHDLYFPSALPQAEIKFSPITKIELDDLFIKFKGNGEKKSNFKKKITIHQSNVKDYSFSSIKINETKIGLYVCLIKNKTLTIRLLRIDKQILHKHTLNSHIIETILQGAVENNVQQIDFMDTECGELIEEGLLDAGFKQLSDKFTKPLEKGFISAKSALNQIGIKAKEDELSKESLFDLERLFWPAKIEELNLPTCIVPIRPQWANKLITSKDSQISLFGVPDRILQTRRVYFRSAGQSSIIQAPGRIIWYISGESTSGATKCAIATSIIDNVEIDSAKKLFSKYERFGVYKWQDVYQTAKYMADKDIMAFTFSKTEVFKSSICLHKIISIIKEQENRNFNIVSPFTISQKTFREIYELGLDV